MVPSLEKERKKKKSSKKLTESLGEQVKPKKSPKKKVQLVNGHTDVVEHVADKAQDKVKDQIESDMEGSHHDTDALSTMNAILEYNRKLMQKLNELEDQKDSIKDPEKTAEDTAKDTVKEVKNEKKETEDKGRSNYSFELPIGDVMKSYGSLSTSELPNREAKEDGNETATVNKNTSEPHKARADEAEKDDVVVKVDATRDGITLTIHIPRI
ncbi:hypothetical protein G6F70_005491 [Rhizopus microsporus]|uniref:Uncharacterized protein n=2 Tax=Rhizopus TaxID=4842 RepID=A0A367KDP6_RHIAZ|nr:hypothetical protein G6F71_004553 [Rhizopus microsporus]RCH99961.1 hypothetical protein CU097_015476 [Rhizopus azygosporus]KAG1198810.1 hypothetical protein G6F70_005491 [Rhizopus microsporus]KAG1210348.1 hypothetical protein G6F69_005546 [Rhizopus microsporus]KAG1232108.1 hypothetical protein G6F67_005246 [Rhizopus microsporus]